MAFPQKNTRQPKTKRMNAYSLREKARVYNNITKNKLRNNHKKRKLSSLLLLKSDRGSPLYDLLSRKQPARTQLNTGARKGLGLRNTLNQKTTWTY